MDAVEGLRSSKKLTPEDIEKTKLAVEEFRSVSGPPLQQILEDEDDANKGSSFIWKMWTEMYLKDRRPVVITHYPWLSFPLDPNLNKRTQLVKPGVTRITSGEIPVFEIFSF